MRVLTVMLFVFGSFAALMAVITYFHEVERKIECRERGGQMIQDFGCVDAKKLKELLK